MNKEGTAKGKDPKPKRRSGGELITADVSLKLKKDTSIRDKMVSTL